jgi:hypothetical protein
MTPTAVDDCHWTGVQPRVHRSAIGAGALCIVALLLTTTNSLLLITTTCKLNSCLLQHCCGCHASASNVGRKLYADRRHPDVVPPQCYGPPSRRRYRGAREYMSFEYMHHSHTLLNLSHRCRRDGVRSRRPRRFVGGWCFVPGTFSPHRHRALLRDQPPDLQARNHPSEEQRPPVYNRILADARPFPFSSPRTPSSSRCEFSQPSRALSPSSHLWCARIPIRSSMRIWSVHPRFFACRHS